jgi:hypothetical protein
MAGGNSGGVTSFLPIAAALAATVATDGAASPWLVEAMGTTAAGALTSGAAAAAASGLTAAVTGQNVGRSALMGGISGGIGGALAGYGAAAGAGTEAATTAAPALTGTNVAGTAAVAPEAYMGGASGAFVPAEGFSATLPQGLGATTPALNMGDAEAQAGGFYGGQAPDNPYANMSDAQIKNAMAQNAATQNSTGSNGIMKWLSDNKGIAAMGGTAALGALMQSDNKKYGTPTAASQKYTGPLSKLHYDPNNYTPLTTPQPSPAYQPKYANYVAQPYNAYAAEGGQVHSYADGGLTQDGPANINFMGNDMYPTSQQQRSYYATPTQAPTGAQQATASYEPNTNPLTGQMTTNMAAGGIAQARRYADGGTTEATQAPQVPQPPQANQTQAPSLVNFAPFAGRYGASDANPQAAMTQDLVSRMAMRNAANPMPGQTPPVVPMQPAGITAAPYAYAAPTFTRPTDTPNIPFQNPKAIRGTAEWNAEQARIAAEAEAKRQAEMAVAPVDIYSGGNGGGAAGGLMPGALKYSGGGKAINNMAAVDDYVAQYQTDPATVTAKAKSGDWNAMIALNKINKTPNQNYAAGGGIGHLGGYAAGGNPRLLKGPGDGMSDNIPATIGGKQPARLADGEFVVPADVVSHLGNGSTDAGAKHLYNMMDKVRKARTGNKKQGKQIKADKFLKA